MKLTLKENVDISSLVFRHNVLLQASTLVAGREGVLQTEKEIYLVLAVVDNLVIENVIELCNNDNRDLGTFMTEEVEPVFKHLMTQVEYQKMYDDIKQLFLNRCKEIWDNQHSAYGVIDAILTMIATMNDEDKQEALQATAKIAEQAFERRTNTMTQKLDATNDKLSQLVNQYMNNQNN